MDLQISGKQIDIGDALRTHVTDRMEASIEKYFDQSVTGHVAFAREGNNFKCDTFIHLSSGISLQSQGDSADIYGAFEIAAEHLEKRVRRYMRRLKDHHKSGRGPIPAADVAYYVIQPTAEEAEEPADLQPVIIAETSEQVKIFSVGEAVMQMDLLDSPVLLFRTEEDGAVNLVYRRKDGNIGWVDTRS